MKTEQMTGVRLSDREMTQDTLISEKQMTGVLSTYLTETETASLRRAFSYVLEDEHEMQNEVFCIMKSRGWYQTTPAEDVKVSSAKTKLSPTKVQV